MRTSDRAVRENSMLLLDFIGAQCVRALDHRAVLSYRQMATATGLSMQQVRLLCLRLEKTGMLVVMPRFASDGGQLANSYALTSRSRLALREARRLTGHTWATSDCR